MDPCPETPRRLKVSAGFPRLVPWQELRIAFNQLLARYGNAAVEDGAVYPFWALQSDQLWEVAETERLVLTSDGRRPTLTSLDVVNPRGGLLNEDYGMLRASPGVLLAGAALVLVRFFDPIPPGLVDAVGLGDGFKPGKPRREMK